MEKQVKPVDDSKRRLTAAGQKFVKDMMHYDTPEAEARATWFAMEDAREKKRKLEEARDLELLVPVFERKSRITSTGEDGWTLE